jgi:hypothetical protein
MHAGRSVAAPAREGDEGILVVTDDSLRSESSHSSLNLFESLIPRDVPSAQMNTRTENSLAGLRPGSSDTRSSQEALLQRPGWHPRSNSTCHDPSLSSGRAASGPGNGWEPRGNSHSLLIRVSCPIQNLDTPPVQLAIPQTPNSKIETLLEQLCRAEARFRPINIDWKRANLLPQLSTVHLQDNLRHSDATNAQNSPDET